MGGDIVEKRGGLNKQQATTLTQTTKGYFARAQKNNSKETFCCQVPV